MPAPDPSKTEFEELDGDMKPADIIEILRQRDAQRLISLDAEVRDFLVRAIAPARR